MNDLFFKKTFLVLIVVFVFGVVMQGPVRLLAQTATTLAGVATTTVSFSVVPQTTSNCIDPFHPTTNVTFAVNPVDGGFFYVSTSTATVSTKVLSGILPLPNGSYFWYGSPNMNYTPVAGSIMQGSFMLTATCSVSPANPNISSASTTPLSPPPGPLASTTVPTGVTQPTTTLPILNTSPVAPLVLAPAGTTTGVTAPFVPPEVVATGVFTADLVFGSTDPEVKILQEFLARDAMLYPEKVIDGFYGTTTVAAVGRLQERYGLGTSATPGYGTVGPKTRALLNDLYANKNIPLAVVAPPSVSVQPIAPALPSAPTAILQKTAVPKIETPSVVLPPSISKMPTTLFPSMPAPAVSPLVITPQPLSVALVNDPSVCQTAAECVLYCGQKTVEKKGVCAKFARIAVASVATSTHSITEGIPVEAIKSILDQAIKRPKEIPAIVKSPEDLQSFCSDQAHIQRCSTALVASGLVSQKLIDTNKALVEEVGQQKMKVFTERVGARVFIDTDHDGISDYDEVNIYHTNPDNPDTDGDGIPDGEEILRGTNPLVKDAPIALATTTLAGGATSTSVTMASVKENPLVSGSSAPSLLSVGEIKTTRATTTSGIVIKGLVVRGKALPNSFVSVYIFSEPTVVTLKTDASGAWTYTLDKELPDGVHHIVSVITDGGGRILAKSEPLPFVKVAEAVTVGSAELPLPQVTVTEEPGFFSGTSFYVFITVLVLALILAIVVIGLVTRRRTATSVSDIDNMNMPMGQ